MRFRSDAQRRAIFARINGLDSKFSRSVESSLFSRDVVGDKSKSEIIGASLDRVTVPVMPDHVVYDSKKQDYLLDYYDDNLSKYDIVSDDSMREGGVLEELGRNIKEKKPAVGSVRVIDEYKDAPVDIAVRADKRSLRKWDRLLGVGDDDTKFTFAADGVFRPTVGDILADIGTGRPQIGIGPGAGVGCTMDSTQIFRPTTSDILYDMQTHRQIGIGPDMGIGG